jgi:hypothetical protein
MFFEATAFIAAALSHFGLLVDGYQHSMTQGNQSALSQRSSSGPGAS